MFTECLSSVLLIKCSICFATEPAGYVNERCWKLSSKLILLADTLDVGMQSCLHCIHYYLYTTSEVAHQINIWRSNYLPRMPQWVLTMMMIYDVFLFPTLLIIWSCRSLWNRNDPTAVFIHQRIHSRLNSHPLQTQNFSVLHEHMSSLCFLSFQTFAYRERAVGGRKVWMSQQGWGSLFSKTKRCIWMSNTGGLAKGPGLWAWVERCSQGGNRFSRKGQACELSAAHSIQPPELRAFILGEKKNVGFIICKNGASKTGLSCSESCTGRDHLSALIESPGCWTGGSLQPSGPHKHTYIHTWIVEAWQWALCRKEHLERGQCGIRHRAKSGME